MICKDKLRVNWVLKEAYHSKSLLADCLDFVIKVTPRFHTTTLQFLLFPNRKQ